MGVCPYYFLLMRAASSATPAHVPLTAISRGGMIESLHSGSIAVVEARPREKIALTTG